MSALPAALEAPVLEWVAAVPRLEGKGRVAAARWRIVEAVTLELRRRVGATFTLRELVAAYYAADWYTELASRVCPNDPEAWDASIALDAAFGLYARAARPEKRA